MGRVVVIGATGHIGTYLVPRPVDRGHEALAWLVANGQSDVGGQPFPAPGRSPTPLPTSDGS
jgi:nucleoside-diphosphate-sugar epimerase